LDTLIMVRCSVLRKVSLRFFIAAFLTFLIYSLIELKRSIVAHTIRKYKSPGVFPQGFCKLKKTPGGQNVHPGSGTAVI
jgi:hypothetical protein